MGHVAYIDYYAGPPATIEEMGYCVTCERVRPSYSAPPDGYIWPLYTM